MDLNSLTVDNETVIDTPPVENAPEQAEPVAAEPAAAEAPAPEAAPDPFAQHGLDPQELAELAELAPMLRQLRDQAYQPQPEAPTDGPPEYDPFDPASVQAWTQWNNNQLLGQIQQMVAPLVGHQQEQVLGEAENRAMDILRDDAARNGDFTGGDTSLQLARMMAEQLIPQYQERYGQGPRAAEAALGAAAAQVRQIEQTIAQQAVEQYKNQMATLAGARTEPGAASAAIEGAGEYKTEMDALAAWQARNAA